MRIDQGSNITATERWLDEIRRGRAFMGAFSTAAVVGESNHHQLFNPVGSAITILARRARAAATAVNTVSLRFYNTALTTNVATLANLLAGGAAPVGQVRTMTSGALLGSVIGYARVVADTPVDFQGDWIAELGAGEGLMVVTETANLGTFGHFEWIELPS